MSTTNTQDVQPAPIALPEATQQRVIEMLRQRDTVQAQIDNVVLTVREALAVPADWELQDLRIGFTPPAAPAAEK